MGKKQFVHPFKVPWKIHANIFKSCDPDFCGLLTPLGCGHPIGHPILGILGDPCLRQESLRAPQRLAKIAKIAVLHDSRYTVFIWFYMYLYDNKPLALDYIRKHWAFLHWPPFGLSYRRQTEAPSLVVLGERPCPPVSPSVGALLLWCEPQGWWANIQ